MRLKERVKTYNFWVSFASAVLLLINTIGKTFNYHVDEKMYNDLFTSFCGILVLLGIIVPPSSSEKHQEEQLERISDENCYQDCSEDCEYSEDNCENDYFEELTEDVIKVLSNEDFDSNENDTNFDS